MSTIREQIIELLEDDELTARELSQALSITEKEVYGHLEHVERTLSRRGRKLKVVPFQCLKCGYEFTKRKRRNKPGRCPSCKKGHIANAVFSVC